MIRSVTTLVYGIILAALVVAAALAAAVWVLGMSVKAALFGDPKATLVVKLFERAMKERRNSPTVITHITDSNEEPDGEEH